MNNRLGYIDLAKGIGMLTIIWGHIHTGISTHIVYAFHIPLFFFLSGLVFNRKRYDNFGNFLKKRWKGLIFPYIVFSVMTWIVWAAYSYTTHAEVQSYWMPLLQTLIAQGSKGYLIHNVPLWFVTCLLVVEIIYYFTSKMYTWANIFVCIVLGSLGVWMSITDVFDFSLSPWSADVALMALPFYTIGSLLNENVGHEKLINVVKNNRLVSILIMLMAAVLLFVGGTTNSQVSMGHAYLGDKLWLFYPVAICGIVAFTTFCLLIATHKTLSEYRVGSGIWFGRNSFRAMAIHNPIKGIIIILLAKSTQSSASVIQSGVLTSFVAFFVTLVVTCLFIRGIERILLKVLKRNSILP